MLRRNLQNHLFLYIVFLFVLHFIIGFPGSFSYDTMDQYKQAATHSYSEHHPPIMAALWSVIMMFTMHPAAMLFLHLALLWGAVYNFIDACKNFGPAKWVFLIIPFFPFMLNNSFIIWKDVGLTFSYLFAASILTKLTLNNNKMTVCSFVLLALTLFYATAIKFIAYYILPVFCWWIAYIWDNKRVEERLNSLVNTKIITYTCFLFCIIFCAKEAANQSLVTKGGETNSWQLVKLYDLTGIALDKDDISVFPKYITQRSEFKKETLIENYNTKFYGVDLLLSPSGLITTNNDQELKELRQQWLRSIIKYPGSYLKHRFILWQQTATIKYYIAIKPEQTMNPEGYQIKYNFIKKALYHYIDFGTKFKYRYVFLFLIPCYFFIGWIHYHRCKSRISIPLIALSLAALSQLLPLFVFSMASDGRYLYFCMFCINFSHIFAYRCYKELQLDGLQS